MTPEALDDPDWRAGWEEHAQRQRARWTATTPAQRLDWLEECLRLAADAGVLGEPHDAPPGAT